MEVRTYRNAVAAALLVALAGCDSEDDSGGGSSSNDPSGSPDTTAQLDELITNADAYRFVATLTRVNGAEGERTGFADTDLYGGFERATEGDMAALLGETRAALVERTTEGCQIGGEYDGVVFDDFSEADDADSAFSEYVSVGDELLVSDESGALGTLRPFDDPEDGQPFYEWDLPDELDRDVVGTLSIEVPGDVAPGLGTVTLPRTPLSGVVGEEPLTLGSTLRWQSPPEGDRFIVAFSVRGDAEGRVDIECITPDDGSFRLPDATLARLPEGLDEIVYYELERAEYDFVSMGETIVSTSRFTSVTVLSDE